MKKIILLLLLLGVAHPTHAQVITIHDRGTGQPLELVTLTSKNRDAFTATNANGKAAIFVERAFENRCDFL